MPDKYDVAMDYLRANPDRVYDSWTAGFNCPLITEDGSCLFGATGGAGCGCLTQVSNGDHRADNPELTAAIRSDTRIPHYGADITVDDLPVFAEWQRRIDRELARPQ